MTRKLDKAYITDLLDRNDTAVERAVLAIYARQTADEKVVGETTKHNTVGFSGAHGNSGSYYARWLLKGRRLTGKHLDKARKMMKHYHRQLLEIAKEKAAKSK